MSTPKTNSQIVDAIKPNIEAQLKLLAEPLAKTIGNWIFNKTPVKIPTKYLENYNIHYKKDNPDDFQIGKIEVGYDNYPVFVKDRSKTSDFIYKEGYSFIEEVRNGGTRKNKGKSRKNKNKSKKMNRKSNKRR